MLTDHYHYPYQHRFMTHATLATTTVKMNYWKIYNTTYGYFGTGDTDSSETVKVLF
jgi:hypothetical protein